MKSKVNIKYFNTVEQLKKLSEKEKAELNRVTEHFAFRSNDYYLSFIDWNDPNDPIRRIIVPHIRKLDQWGWLGPSDEEAYMIMPGLEHKYNSTVLLLVSDVCGGICQYCFRKHLFIESHKKHRLDISSALEYIKQHFEVTNVLLTGGDPLVLTTSKLENIIRQLRQIDHVQIIRIGTKMPAFNPYRIVDDPILLKMMEKYSMPQKKIYLITHFVHPRELTDVAIEAVHLLHKSGAVIANQMPLIKGVNTNPDVLAKLLASLSFIGAVPYYIFQCRPVLGNRTYTVPIEQGYEIIEQAKSQVSGLAKRIRFVMSHSSGKIEIVGKTEEHVYFKYHRAARDEDSGCFMIFKSNPNAYWLEDYDEIIQNWPSGLPYRSQVLE